MNQHYLLKAIFTAGFIFSAVAIALQARQLGASAAQVSKLASTQLCAINDCSAVPDPSITEINGEPVGRGNPMAPVILGQPVYIKGSGLYISGRPGRPKCYLQTGAGNIYLDSSAISSGFDPGPTWSDNSAYGVFYPTSNSPAQSNATLEIVRNDGRTGSLQNVLVINPQTMQMLSPENVLIYAQGQPLCSDNADLNQCNGWANFPNPTLPAILNVVSAKGMRPTASAYAMHGLANPQEAASNGTDQFGFALKNGWVVVAATLVNVTSVGNGSTVANPVVTYLKRDEAWAGTVSVNWTASQQVQYYLQIWIRGPKHLPWW